MSGQTKYRANPVVSFKDEGDEGAVLYNPDTDKSIVLNAVGSIIWRFIEEARTSDEIISLLTENFSGVDTEQAREDLKEFINNFEEGFIDATS